LRDANDDDSFTGSESSAIFCYPRILTLPAFKRDDRNAVAFGERMDAGDEVIVSGFEQRRGRNGVAEVVVEEVAQASGRLQLWHVGVQIHAIDAPDFERDVVTDNVGDVGRHQNLLAEIPVMVLLTEDAGHVIGPNIVYPNDRAAAAKPKVRRSDEGSEALRPAPHVQWRAGLARRFEAKLRCHSVKQR